ncbi:MAG: hypothetical protein JNL75_08545 [Chitinophagales bacterium]|nr:hypothetical protein [Chitinophagales bacterium]
MDKKIIDLVSKYSDVYKDLKELQPKDKNDKTSLLPTGDQITGVIAEYYAKIYIERTEKCISNYSSTNESYDILCNNIKYQVKSVSSYSKTRVIAPLNLKENGFDYLLLFDLDYNFLPIGFYINSYADIKRRLSDLKKQDIIKIVGSLMKSHGNSIKKSNGSAIYNFNNNKINDLMSILDINN